jgi:phosphoribosylformylglycinamidine (FGAM) synthase PurS component
MAKTTQSSAELKRAFAQEIMAEAAKKGITNPVIVLPAVIDGELIEDTCVVPSKKNPTVMGYVSFYQVAPMTSKNKRLDLEIEHWAISVGRIDRFEAKYEVGQILPGRIAIEETLEPPNAEDIKQDVKYASKACQDAGVPCTVNDEIIYQIKYYDPSGKSVDVLLAHDNFEEIEEVNAAAKAAANKANSGALRGAANRKQK